MRSSGIQLDFGEQLLGIYREALDGAEDLAMGTFQDVEFSGGE